MISLRMIIKYRNLIPLNYLIITQIFLHLFKKHPNIITMKIFFASITVADPAMYITNKLKCDPLLVSNYSSDAYLVSQLPIVDKNLYGSEYEKLSQDKIEKLRDRQACGIRYINAQYPLLNGEQIEYDFFSYLEKPLSEYPEGTPVLLRKTNMASIYFLFELHEWNGNEVNIIPPVEGNNVIPLSNMLSSNLVEKLVVSLLKGIATKAGGAIFDFAFPENHFDVDYERIQEIVRKSINQSIISEKNGILNGVILYMQTNYKAEVENRRSSDYLIQTILHPEAMKMSDLISTLAHNEFKEIGLSVYMEAVAIYLGILQEMAILDKSKERYKESTFYTISTAQIILSAKKHITDTILVIQEKRRNMVTSDSGTGCRPAGDGAYGCEFYTYYMWKDSLNAAEESFIKSKDYDAEACRNNSMNSRKKQVSDKCKTDLQIDKVLEFLNQI